MLDQVAPWAGLVGLIGFAGLAGFKHPVDKERSGGGIRLLGLLGLTGLCGFWIPGAGAIGASGALGLWNHQYPKLAFWGKLGWAGVVGVPFLVRYVMG
jgi:hypothetical protein